MSKTHYAEIQHIPESNVEEHEGPTLCGINYTESPVSDDINDVDCKRCLARWPSYLEEIKAIKD